MAFSKTFQILGITLILLGGFAFNPWIMPVEGSGPLETPSHDRVPLPDFIPEITDEPFELPPVAPHRPLAPDAGPSFVLTDIVLEGHTVFSDAELKAVAEPFFHTSVTLADLEEIRYRLTLFYVHQGYVSSGALIKPDQQVTGGVITYQIVEGTLTRIDINGLGRLRPGYVAGRIWPQPKVPFNTEALQEYFQLLLQNPLIERMDGRILPGTAPGDTVLELDVTRPPPYQFSLSVHNHSSPNLGSETVGFDSTLRNLTGLGDALDFGVAISEGVRDLNTGFTLPITARDTLLGLRYNASKNDVVAPSLKSLDIRSEFSSLEASLMHPVYRTLRRNISIGAALRKAESQSFILRDMPFAFAEEAIEGKTRATVLRLIQTFQDRTPKQVFAFRSTISFGLDVWNPTIHDDDRPDGRFVAWLVQAQYGHRIGEKAGHLVLSGDLQLANDRLLGMEKFAVGGAGSVRGYRKNRYLGDNGARLSLEWRLPIWTGATRGQEDAPQLQVVPFVDYGTTWDRSHPYRDRTASDNTLLSAGTGLVFTAKWVYAELFYGYAIEDTDRIEDYNLQDDGVHFRVSVRFP